MPEVLRSERARHLATEEGRAEVQVSRPPARAFRSPAAVPRPTDSRDTRLGPARRTRADLPATSCRRPRSRCGRPAAGAVPVTRCWRSGTTAHPNKLRRLLSAGAPAWATPVRTSENALTARATCGRRAGGAAAETPGAGPPHVPERAGTRRRPRGGGNVHLLCNGLTLWQRTSRVLQSPFSGTRGCRLRAQTEGGEAATQRGSTPARSACSLPA